MEREIDKDIKNNEEFEEVLETSIPEDLKKYLEADEDAFEKIDIAIDNLKIRKEDLENQKKVSEKEFEERLKKFKEQLNKEKEETFNNFEKQKRDVDSERKRIEDIKLEEQAKQVKYIDAIKNVYNSYTSKMETIETAIQACADNTILNKALEEEENKLKRELISNYNKRKTGLGESLNKINITNKKDNKPKKEETKVTPKKEVKETKSTINKDYAKELEESKVNIDDSIIKNTEKESENEIVNFEIRKDVINEIYQSKDIMEGHVFPYLNKIME